MGAPAEMLAEAVASVEPRAREAWAAARKDAVAWNPDDDVSEHVGARYGSVAHEVLSTSTLPTLKEFKAKHYQPGVPLVMRGAAADWPAVARWRDLSYLDNVLGHRTVPLEIGVFGTPGWREEARCFGCFARDHLSQSRDEPAYLAQHSHLLEQASELAGDLGTPPYVAALSGGMHQLLCWIGTARTVTPLHYDGYDTCFVQLVGKKRFVLFDKSETPRLYVTKRAASRSGRPTNNFSAVDVESPDLAAFPLFAEAVGTEVTLCPGDVLYLPSHVWHHVQSLTSSASVSYAF